MTIETPIFTLARLPSVVRRKLVNEKNKNDEFFRKFFLCKNVITSCTKSLRRFTRLPPNILNPKSRDYMSIRSHLIFPYLATWDSILGILVSLLTLVPKVKEQRLLGSDFENYLINLKFLSVINQKTLRRSVLIPSTSLTSKN